MRVTSYRGPALKFKVNLGAVLTAVMVVLLIVGLATMLAAWGEVREAITGARPGPLLLALLVSGAAYATVSLRFATFSRVFKIHVPFLLLWQVGYVATLLGRNVVGGGTVGIMLIMAVLKRRSIPLSRGATVSLVQSYVNLLIALALLLAAVGYAVFGGLLGSVHSGALYVTIAVLSSFAAASAFALFGRRFRSWLIDWLVATVQRWTGRNFEDFGVQFSDSVDEGMRALRNDVGRMAAIVLMLGIESALTLLSLWLCFESVGQAPDLGVLLAGYGIGLAIGMVSLIPGGLGVQEGSMAGVYAFLGIPLSEAVAVATLFRAVHYFVPFLASLLLYREMLRRGVGEETGATEVAVARREPGNPQPGS